MARVVRYCAYYNVFFRQNQSVKKETSSIGHCNTSHIENLIQKVLYINADRVIRLVISWDSRVLLVYNSSSEAWTGSFIKFFLIGRLLKCKSLVFLQVKFKH